MFITQILPILKYSVIACNYAFKEKAKSLSFEIFQYRMIHFEIKNNILQVWFKEEVNYDDIMAYLEDFLRLADLPLNLKIIYDLTDAKIDLKIPQIIKISKLAKTATLEFDTVKTAFVVNDPGVTAYTMLFIFNSVSSKNIRKVFSTVDSAYSWVC